MKSYLIKISKCKSIEVVLKVQELVESHKEKFLQQCLVNLGQKIVVDGIFGRQTARAICKTKTSDLLNALNNYMEEDDATFKTDEKTSILAYLAREEGDYFHWNKNESTYTSPYGVYKEANRNSKVIKYCDSLIKKYDIRETRKGIKKLNSKLNSEERKKIRDLVYDLYSNVYINKSIDKILRGKRFYHTRLSVFSFAVNAGLKRAIIKLQQTIGAYPDGLVGKKTIAQLNNVKISDNELNSKYLYNVKRFYDTLIRNNYEYEQYKNGWYNRLRRLGLKI